MSSSRLDRRRYTIMVQLISIGMAISAYHWTINIISRALALSEARFIITTVSKLKEIYAGDDHPTAHLIVIVAEATATPQVHTRVIKVHAPLLVVGMPKVLHTRKKSLTDTPCSKTKYNANKKPYD